MTWIDVVQIAALLALALVEGVRGSGKRLGSLAGTLGEKVRSGVREDLVGGGFAEQLRLVVREELAREAVKWRRSMRRQVRRALREERHRPPVVNRARRPKARGRH